MAPAFLTLFPSRTGVYVPFSWLWVRVCDCFGWQSRCTNSEAKLRETCSFYLVLLGHPLLKHNHHPMRKLKLAHMEKTHVGPQDYEERDIWLVPNCSSFWLLLFQPPSVFNHISATMWETSKSITAWPIPYWIPDPETMTYNFKIWRLLI